MWGVVALRPTPSEPGAGAPQRRLPRVLVADDYAPMRLGVCAVLHENGFEICAEAVDAASAVEAALRERPDVCLLEIYMPGDGVAAAEAITASLPDTAVVMLTVSHEPGDFCRALRAGACAYLLKDADPETLPLALQCVLRGEATVPRPLVARIVDDLRERDARDEVLRERGVMLTSREQEVLDLLCEGLPTAEIAQRLFVSGVTVRTHICAILKKLHVPDRAAAISLLNSPIGAAAQRAHEAQARLSRC